MQQVRKCGGRCSEDKVRDLAARFGGAAWDPDQHRERCRLPIAPSWIELQEALDLLAETTIVRLADDLDEKKSVREILDKSRDCQLEAQPPVAPSDAEPQAAEPRRPGRSLWTGLRLSQ